MGAANGDSISVEGARLLVFIVIGGGDNSGLDLIQ
jgi:hypothetical protein